MLVRVADSDTFQNVCDAVQDAVCILDPDLTIIQANSTMKRWFGQKAPLVGQKCYQVILGQQEPCVNCPCSQALKLKDRQAKMVKFVDDGGVTRWYEIYAFPLQDKRNRVVGIVEHIRDATLRVNAERQQLKATEALARAEKLSSLAALTAGITHELSQPLNAIKVLADSMLFWFERGRIPETDEMIAKLKDISEQTDRADQIIKHVRSLINGDQEAGSRAPCNLNNVITKATNLVSSQLRAHGIIVEKNLAAKLPLILGDEIRLQEAIINLLINAMQSLDQVSHKEKKITIETRSQQDKVIIKIEDNGLGLDEKIVDRLFDPFVTTKLAQGGMGLGLSFVQSVLQAHKATISGRNRGKRGAVFQLKFPTTSLPGGNVV